MEELYGGIFETTPTCDDPPIVNFMDSTPVFYPITADEISSARCNWRPSAAGSDGIRVDAVKRTPIIDLEVLFVFLKNATPASWRKARTVMIHKGGDRIDPTNWKPVSVGSALQRLLH